MLINIVMVTTVTETSAEFLKKMRYFGDLSSSM
ncbi:hypothetical protein SAMN05444161_5373 [Rhizobiales bacterium GAS191]|nr:hypothetical protein SAMN05519103_04610 [Rhizobiales bacterium GAS113]SEE27498.1 hypothetical protein SAMN05519104_5649 [Rhizobiales bacterium GAS188]SEE30266.1 hypothetical protein SAMN05444161_5373 [Rhizobiales bacterium GAS191]